MEELRSILIKHGYTGEIPDDLEDEKYKKLIQAIVNDLKSCDDLTGESKRRFDEMKRLSVECNKEQFQVILGKQKKQQLREIDRDKSQAAELEEREGPLKERLQALNHVHKHLTLQHEQCIRDKEKAILHLTECKKNYYEALDKSKEMNQMFNSSLNQLQHTLTDFFNFYADQSKIRDSNGKVTTPPLLSSLSPLPYFESEEIFTRTLSEYAKTQLPPGTASMADTSDIKEYSVLDDTQLIHRLSEEDYVKNSKELKRLESAYALVESQLLSYEVMKSFMKSSCKRLEDEIDLIKMGEGVIKTDVATLNQMIEAKEELLTELKAKYHNLSDNVLPKQLKELTSLRICRILHGDHDLKLARQNYYSSKQDEVHRSVSLSSSHFFVDTH
jgi:HAUS augmin-like complex subunit 3